MGLGTDAFLKMVFVWEAHDRGTVVSMAVSCNKVSRSYRKERKLPMLLGICPVPQETATYLDSLSPCYNKTLFQSRSKTAKTESKLNPFSLLYIIYSFKTGWFTALFSVKDSKKGFSVLGYNIV